MKSKSLSRLILLTAAALTMLPTAAARAENWPQWRGAELDGISHETDLPLTWSKTENVAWRLELPGPAGSTPVVWDDHIYLTSAEGNDLVLMAVGTDGKQLWKQRAGRPQRGGARRRRQLRVALALDRRQARLGA